MVSFSGDKPFQFYTRRNDGLLLMYDAGYSGLSGRYGSTLSGIGGKTMYFENPNGPYWLSSVEQMPRGFGGAVRLKNLPRAWNSLEKLKGSNEEK